MTITVYTIPSTVTPTNILNRTMAVSTVWWITMEAPRRLMGARGVKGPKCLPPGSPRGAGYLPNILIMDQRLTVQGIKKQNKKISKKKLQGLFLHGKKKNPSIFFSKVLILIKTVIKQKISNIIV